MVAGVGFVSAILALRVDNAPVSRRGAIAAGVAAVSLPQLSIAHAVDNKLRNLPPAEIAEIVKADIVDRQFLATAKFTREIYDEKALFTDEIDTYTLPAFIKGTSALFVADRSSVSLVGDVQASSSKVC